MCIIFFKMIATKIHTPPPTHTHTPRALISLDMYVCVCVLCIVSVEDGDPLKNSSGSTYACAVS